MDAKEKMKALRARLGLTQDDLAERADLLRQEINKIETGKNRVSTLHIVRALARAAGSSLEDMADYFDGTLSLEDLWRRIQARRRAQDKGAGAPVDPYPNRTLGATVCRESGRISEEAIQEVWNEPPPSRDRATFDWIKLFEAAEIRIRAHNPTPPPFTTTRRAGRKSDRPPSSKQVSPATPKRSSS